jgi:hypothetical protein
MTFLGRIKRCPNLEEIIEGSTICANGETLVTKFFWLPIKYVRDLEGFSTVFELFFFGNQSLAVEFDLSVDSYNLGLIPS